MALVTIAEVTLDWLEDITDDEEEDETNGEFCGESTYSQH
jgi:hypothetical protein